MNILITGAKGFVGKNLTEALKNIRDNKDRTRPALKIGEICEYDLDTPQEKLAEYCEKADFVFHLAGVNRPQDPAEFMAGNFGFSSELLSALKQSRNTCPVMLSSSIQATLIGRYDACRPLRRFGVWAQQEGRGGAVLCLCGRDGRQSARLSFPQPLRQVVPPQL